MPVTPDPLSGVLLVEDMFLEALELPSMKNKMGSPFFMEMYRPELDALRYSVCEQYLKAYVHGGVGKWFPGLTLKDYLELPVDVIAIIDKICEEQAAPALDALNKLSNKVGLE